MHLRSVEIQGFKTFAKKTELLFEPGITAVVGPNGSGKSNLVDAIRWVLGERSARELRGTRMEEIVYSGGARRPGSGMAEVRLVIDNSDGRLAVPYSEIEVLRRGYRSGESEYWLNGARCRLRDIEELFASTGLTQQGYSVVAQDDVDHIIQTSAGERRALIEEAAGVRGLRTKRDDALGRIREADITVLRLNDLAGELGPRVEELRRQADAARSEAELTARLDVLRGSLLRGEWLAARQRVKKAAARVVTLEAAVTQARADAATAAAAHANQREELARAHDARLARERELGSLRLAAGDAGAQLQLLAERIAAAASAAMEAGAVVEAAMARRESLENELRVAADDAAAASEPPAEVTADPALAVARDALAGAQAARQHAEQRLVGLHEAAAAAEQHVSELQQRRDALAAAGEDLLAELARAETELGAEQGHAPEVRTAEAAATRAAERLRAAITAQSEARSAVNAAREAAQSATSRVQRLEERLSALRSLAADGDLPAPSASRLVELLQEAGVRNAAIAAGISAATLDAWAEEGRLEGRAISRALEEGLHDQQDAAARQTEAGAALAAAIAREAELESLLEEARQAQLTALAAVSAAAARDASRAQGLDAARHRVERLRAAVAERRGELGTVASNLAAAIVAAGDAQAQAEEAEPALLATRQAEATCQDDVDARQRLVDQKEAQRAALSARAEALVARRNRAEAQLAAQVAETVSAQERVTELARLQTELDGRRSEAEARHAAALGALEVAPADATAGDVSQLSERLLGLEKEYMERQVALAHHEDALGAALAVQAEAEAAVADLAGRMGQAGEAEPADEELDWEKTQREITRLERQVAHLGPVNPLAIEEYERDHERLDAIGGQLDDLVRAREGLVKLSEELTGEIDRRFEAVFGAVAYNFQETFATLFVNGKATLRLDDPDAEEPGVEILAQPAGKRMRGIRLLSGGERALTALAFILALEKVNPSPFYIFDEVDAPLDDANVKRFNAMLLSMAAENQFILITHNHQTMTSAQALYGVTLEDSGVSRVVSVRLREGEVVALKADRTG
ncbi:MAG: chromosome segregation protein [Chloroflexota bacterium]|nr:chromosome segregation protein [Chloroflexota bacterium]